MILVQIHAANKNNTKIEDFYDQLETLIQNTKKYERTLIITDFNAKTIGDVGLGEGNERGDRLTHQFAHFLFKLPNRGLYTWKAPADSREMIIRNQIEYIAAPIKFQNSNKAEKGNETLENRIKLNRKKYGMC